MSRLCTICARGGSKGVPNKNLRMVGGSPLIAHSIRHAIECQLFDTIAVSSDSAEILELSRHVGADLCIERPAYLATDTASKLDAIQHAVQASETETGTTFSIITDLCPTAPLRFISDIFACVAAVETGDVQNIFSVTPAHRSPYFNLVEIDGDGRVRLSKPPVTPLVRRQDAPACYDMNASIYVWKREPFIDKPYLFAETTALHVMPRERSFDIDTPLDLEIVEMLMARRYRSAES